MIHLAKAELVRDERTFLAALEKARAYLGECKKFDDAKALRDQAEAARVWARARGDARALEIMASELRLRSEKRMGELLPEKPTPAEAGARGGRGNEKPSDDATALSRQDVSRLRAIAAVPEAIVEAEIERAKKRNEPVKTAAVLRAAKTVEVKAKLEEVAAKHAVAPTGIYDVLVVDPPWPLENFERESRPNQAAVLDYPIMSVDEIKALSIPAAEDAHLFLWTTQKYLPVAFEVLAAWGFRYVCEFVWHKPGGMQVCGLPQFNHEPCLYARKGSPIFLDGKAFFTCFEAPRGKHSEKPEAFYDVVRRVTGGRRLDMFNRRPIEGFDTWGNEAAHEPAAGKELDW